MASPECSFRGSLYQPLVDPHRSAPNPCFVASTSTIAQGLSGVFVLVQILLVFYTHYGPHRIRYSFGNALSTRSVGLFQLVRVSLALLHGTLLLALTHTLYENNARLVTTQLALVSSVVTFATVVPLHVLEVTRSVVGHGSLLLYWFISALSFSIITAIDLFSPHKVFVPSSGKKAASFTYTLEFSLIIISTINFILENHYYLPSKELLEYFDLNGWDPSTVKNLVETLLFTWVTPLLGRIQAKDSFEKDEIPNVAPGYANDVLFQNLEAAWNNEIKRATWWRDRRVSKSKEPTEEERKIKPSLLLVIFKLNWSKIIAAALLRFADVLLSTANPFFVKAFIKFFASYTFFKGSEQGPPLIQGFALAFGIYGISVAKFLAGSVAEVLFSEVDFGVRSALITSTYEKAIKLSPEARTHKTAGEIINHVSIDINGVSSWLHQASSVLVAPVRLVLSLGALYKLLGNSTWAGFGVILVLSPISSVMGFSLASLFKAQMEYKDKRIKLTSEILNSIKSLKLYSWEKPMLEKLNKVRNTEELQYQKRIGVNIAASQLVWESIPDWITYTVYAVYGIYSKSPLTPDIVFSSYSLFNQLLQPIIMIPFLLINLLQVRVHSSRLESYFSLDELNTPFNHTNKPLKEGDVSVSLKNSWFFWTQKDADDSENETSYALKDINFEAKKGSLTCIVGKVGSGKTTLLKSIIGELPTSSKRSHSEVNGKIAYCAQNAWILNATLKQNILFGKRFNEAFYNKTIEACQLLPDLEALPKGDATLVGDKGISLSGGQKARLSLARAVYARADIYLLDDVLSAVDSYVGKKIIDAVLSSKGLLASKTIILATNSVKVLKEAGQIYYISKGEILEHGSYKTVIQQGGDLATLIKEFEEESNNHASEGEEEEEAFNETKTSDAAPSAPILLSDSSGLSHDTIVPLKRVKSNQTIGNASLVSFGHVYADDNQPTKGEDDEDSTQEKKQSGSVKARVFLEVAKASKYQFVILWAVVISLAVIIGIYRNLILKSWSEKNEKSGENVQLRFYLSLYAATGVLVALIKLVGSYVLWAFCALNCAKFFHDRMARSVIKAPMSFFDTTPIGRILNRFTDDVSVSDSSVLPLFGYLFEAAISTLIQVATILVNLPGLTIVVLLLSALFLQYRKWYIPASRELKRLQSTLKSPIFSHLQESIDGTETLRAYSEQERFKYLSRRLVDDVTRASLLSVNVNQWLSIRLSSLSSIIVLASTISCLLTLLTKHPLSTGMVGFLLAYAVSSTSSLDMIIRIASSAEVNLVSIERLIEYANLPQEAPEVIEDHRPLSNWPAQGTINFDNYSTRYRAGLPSVLKSINVQFKPSEKVGIVGRTGAGKSSLTLALFRLIEATGGTINIDGIDSSQIGIADLREKLNIIPQDAHAFAGSVRENLDPFGRYSDEELWRVLELAHLKDHIESLAKPSKDDAEDANKDNENEESRDQNGLDAKISEGGSNLSSGQKQLLCLARALLKPSKILVLDEATASVDVQTDKIIQETIRKEFKDNTIITIAHRLETVLDSDRILVLDKGEVKEFDTPKTLLANKSSEFYSLCKEGGFIDDKGLKKSS
ncbi:hypothetical protein FT663_04617 [Candidozyma haemuli var. vulneris]|uniref:Uncharacterized protein n=1 Tax=Candidozyma haemuli TaxID=45357 RepID=A0A2V1B150_9ASCO|nr:hypothetical protein CXQ85_003753 [[Candida] haemuloni]KAF3987062.1 hypothetical protein FT663_04617 [[Candida] haemuloni var. vulneris]KAF3988853.1 hypothetical protein FT662_03162 [[Candida] haemuloni var. vulneris]PVH23463.1 hypothetical protein CXQ85_003753 [[Candida] haemuloni]